jgi:ABC-type lipoprotein release transport system permease subunit
MIEALTALRQRLGKVIRYSEANKYELINIFNSFDNLVGSNDDNTTIRGIGVENSEIDRYVDLLSDGNTTQKRKEEYYLLLYTYLVEKIDMLRNRPTIK